jgi:hypothetical protein
LSFNPLFYIQFLPSVGILTLPPAPPLKHKGRSETTVYHRVTPFPLTLRGRDGVRVIFLRGRDGVRVIFHRGSNGVRVHIIIRDGIRVIFLQ